MSQDAELDDLDHSLQLEEECAPPKPKFYIPIRIIVAAMLFLCNLVSILDRSNISVAIVPMAKQFQWNNWTQGIVISSFNWGLLFALFFRYMFTQHFILISSVDL
jgi:hypothetical protein